MFLCSCTSGTSLSSGHMKPAEPGDGACPGPAVPAAQRADPGLWGSSYESWPLEGGLASSWLQSPGMPLLGAGRGGCSPRAPIIARTRSGSGQASHIQTHLYRTKRGTWTSSCRWKQKISGALQGHPTELSQVNYESENSSNPGCGQIRHPGLSLTFLLPHPEMGWSISAGRTSQVLETSLSSRAMVHGS